MGKSVTKHRSWERILTLLLALAMLAAYVPAVGAARAEEAETGKYVLEANTLEAFAAGDKADGDPTPVGDFFTILWSAKSKVDSSNKSWDDGYSSGQRINFGGAADTGKNSIKFTTTAPATVKIWWAENGDNNRQITILDSNGEPVATTTGEHTANTAYLDTLELTEAGTYYLGSTINGNYIFKVEVTETPAEVTYDLEAKSLEAFAAGDKADGDPTPVGDFFTILWSAKSKVDSSNKSWDDGYSSGQRINFGGAADTGKNSIKFTTTGPATVKIWWAENGDNNRQITILDSNGEPVATTTGEHTANTAYLDTLELTEAGTYYLGSTINGNYIFRVTVTMGGGTRASRADWADVAAPVITNVALAAGDGNTINVTVTAEVGYDGADSLTVTMKDAEGNELAIRNSLAEKEEHVLSFAPADSGTYTFTAALIRDGEEDKASDPETFAFIFPLTAPVIKGAYNDGNGTMTVEWNAVHEAESYDVTVGERSQNVTGTSATFEGLTVGEEVTFTVEAVRGEEIGPESTIKATVTADAEMRWTYAAFGNSTDTNNNGYSGSYSDGEVRVWSKSGKGKIQTSSHDGISFYYTAIDPKTTNFVLEATGHVNEWTYSNGQEGFGLAALDRVGVHGSSDTGAIFYNNSYMTSIATFSGFRQGVAAIEKWGTNSDNYANPEGDGFTTLVSSLSDYFTGSGTKNIVGNATNPGAITAVKPDNIDELLVDFTFRLEKNNTGYFMTYIAPDGTEYTKKTYDPENLTQLDDMVYIGFFAARNFDVTFTEISLTFSDPETDDPAEDRPSEYIAPDYSFIDRGVSNSPEGEIVYRGNVDGTIVITNEAGDEIYSGRVTANKNLFLSVDLVEGVNNFSATITPDEDFHPDGLSYKWLTSYEPRTVTKSVTYTVDARDVIYVGPGGTDDAEGTRENPTTLAEAVKAPAPGTKIVLLAGEYSIGNVTIRRGINGTEDAMILLTADEGARPVLTGSITIESNYWHFYGFDVTGSSSNGVHVAGSYNLIERIRTYKNSNTGLQISRQGSYEGIDEWPSYNTILNCSSYLNSDPGFEDADGFAAKLTVGKGNVFDGCIAAYNADDGWDLFARGERIGTVTIKNSIAFKNGWLWNEDHWWTGTDSDKDIIDAGNGNGFKMGGSGYEGGHTLINSIAFANKANGITCNSCPDIKVYNSTSFDNGGANLTVYSSITGQTTDFAVDGYISYGTSSASNDSIKPAGSQTLESLLGANNYYMPDGNTEGVKAAAEWFKSLDTAAAISGDSSSGIFRNDDGSINMNGYLELTDEAPSGAGARFTVSQTPEKPEPETDTSALETAVAKAEALKSSDYTASSYKAVTEAVAAGKAVLENADATQEEIDAAAKAIEDAISKLVKASTGGGSTSGGTSGGGTSGGSTTPDDSGVTTDTTAQGGETAAPTTTTTATPSASTSDDGKSASSNVSDEMAEKIVEQAEANDSDSVVIQPDISDNVTSAKVTIPGEALAELGEKTGADVTVKTPVGDVTIPNEALEKLGSDGGSVTVSVEINDDGTTSVDLEVNGQSVNTVNGGIKAALPIENGQVMVLVDADGNETIIRKSLVDNGIAYVLLDGSATVKIVENSKPFDDVDSSSAYLDAVAFASSHGLFVGTSDSTFSPDDSMTRAMLATVLWRLESETEAVGNVISFTDMADGSWYADAVAWASSAGVVLGTGDDSFSPDMSITREQLATMLYRYAGVVGLDTTKRASLSDFTDADELSDWATDAMEWAVAEELIQGKGDGILDAAGPATRAQVAIILQRLISLMVK